MNTRLQVEHPITEFVSGLDLVELMIRIAAGERLTLRQEDIPIKGWAMESRVYAEDPLRNFLPSIGTLIRYKEPTSEDGTVRIDSGVREGDNISIYYDPLISKLITFGKNRLEAINKMAKALDSYIIRGVNHNVCFLRAMMEHPRYKSGDISTKFIPQEYPQGFKGYQLNQQELDELIISTSVIHIMRLTRDATITGQLQQYEPPKHFIVTFNNQDYDIQIEKVEENNNFKIFVNGKLFSLKTNWPIDSLLFKSFINEKEVIIQLIQINSLGYKLQHYGTQFDIHIFTPLQKKSL
jgi:propionyl-CoA carboxylase alpha chain